MRTDMPEVLTVSLRKGNKYQRLLAGRPQTCGIKSGYVMLNPGDSVGEHVTEKKEEAIIIIKGTAQIICVGKEPFTMQPQSVIYIPPQTKHNVINIGDNILEYIYVVAPVLNY